MTLTIAKSKKYLNEKSLKKEFNKNGWVLCKNEIPKSLIKKIKKDWDFYFKAQISLKANEAIKKINKNNKKLLHQICINLSNSSSFLEVLKCISKTSSLLIYKALIFSSWKDCSSIFWPRISEQVPSIIMNNEREDNSFKKQYLMVNNLWVKIQ